MSIAEPRIHEPGAATGPSEADIAALLGALGDDAKVMLDRDIALARAELRQSVGHVRSTGIGFGAAALLACLSIGALTVAAGLGLAEVVHPALAFLIVGLALAAIAGVALAVGRKNLEALDPMPRETIENIKEDLAWLRERMS